MLTWRTTEKEYRNWERNFCKWEKQYAYERGIVRSVPPMHIEVSSVDPVADDRCDPG